MFYYPNVYIMVLCVISQVYYGFKGNFQLKNPLQTMFTGRIAKKTFPNLCFYIFILPNFANYKFQPI